MFEYAIALRYERIFSPSPLEAVSLSDQSNQRISKWVARSEPRVACESLVLCLVLILGYALSCTTLRVVEITTRSVVQLSLSTYVFNLDEALGAFAKLPMPIANALGRATLHLPLLAI